MTDQQDGLTPSPPTLKEQHMARDDLVEVLTEALEKLDTETGEGLADMPYQDIAEALADTILRKAVKP
ncbi:hypothetical protein OG618_37010 (plasmid) [Kitasatospora sp. NBC_01246]|uniref:hypothetical protein n=1 Tax=Kitasatospora sp. NBC_01246 TaxID=2903570 RepID=UPI002E379805|nr:hypothetical protein [Kitasatospora sp. NBC_01246]